MGGMSPAPSGTRCSFLRRQRHRRQGRKAPPPQGLRKQPLSGGPQEERGEHVGLGWEGRGLKLSSPIPGCTVGCRHLQVAWGKLVVPHSPL